MKRTAVLLNLLIWSSTALAARAPSENPCPSQVHHSALDNTVQFASIIVPEEGVKVDPRKTYEQLAEIYAAEQNISLDEAIDQVYDKFSANGTMFCKDKAGEWTQSSANVVDKNNVLLMSAHAFYDDNCQPISGSEDFSACVFQTNPRPPQKAKLYHVKSVKSGTKCPTFNKDGSLAKKKDDWAVVTLQKPVAGVHPFHLNRNCRVSVGWTGINIASSATNFGDGKTAAITPSCSARHATGNDGTFKTDCSNGKGNSGGGMLCDADKSIPAIGGILVQETAPNRDPDFHVYDRYTNHGTALPINDEIEAVIKASGS